MKENYLDLHELFCGNDDSCPIAIPEGYLISYDGVHLTREGAIHLSKLLRNDEEFMSLWGSAFGSYFCPEPGNEKLLTCPTDQGTDSGSRPPAGS